MLTGPEPGTMYLRVSVGHARTDLANDLAKGDASECTRTISDGWTHFSRVQVQGQVGGAVSQAVGPEAAVCRSREQQADLQRPPVLIEDLAGVLQQACDGGSVAVGLPAGRAAAHSLELQQGGGQRLQPHPARLMPLRRIRQSLAATRNRIVLRRGCV